MRSDLSASTGVPHPELVEGRNLVMPAIIGIPGSACKGPGTRRHPTAGPRRPVECARHDAALDPLALARCRRLRPDMGHLVAAAAPARGRRPRRQLGQPRGLCPGRLADRALRLRAPSPRRRPPARPPDHRRRLRHLALPLEPGAPHRQHRARHAPLLPRPGLVHGPQPDRVQGAGAGHAAAHDRGRPRRGGCAGRHRGRRRRAALAGRRPGAALEVSASPA